MAKVEFKKLPMGVALEPSHLYGNVGLAIAEFNASRIEADQRREDRAMFTMTWTTHRGNGLASLFSIPPLQEYWNVSSSGANLLEADQDTPIPRLERIVFSFDNNNSTSGVTDGALATYPIPDSATRPFTQDSIVTLRKGDQIVAQSRVLLGELTVDNDIIGQRPNPQALANLGVDLDPFGVYTIHFQAPLVTGVDSVVIQAVFSHPIVERDTSTILDTYVAGSGNIAQNAPLHNLARSNPSYSITPATPGQNINADGANGVQTTIETVDDIFRNRLRGGLTPYSDVVTGEALKENHAYFCDVVPLFKTSEGLLATAGGADTIDNYTIADAAGNNVLYDRAIIPITQPFTVHHAMIGISGVVVGGVALADREIEIGIGLLSGVRTQAANYTQVAYRKFDMSSTSGVVGKVSGTVSGAYLWSVPVVYSAAAGKNGRGYITQGRPVYGGRQRATASGVLRRNSASYNPAAAEAAPPTNGAEQYLEVRVVMRQLSGGTITDWSLTSDYTVCSQSGVNVYIAGKRALGV